MAQATPASERSADGGSKLIENLQNARRIVLHDPRHYPTIVTAIQRCFQDKSNISARVWMANLLAESFGAPTWSQEQKEPQALAMLEILEGMVSEKDTNTEMVKSGIQIAASIYRIVFNYICTHSDSTDSEPWERMIRIKSSILRLWDNAPSGVSVCCIKFVIQVILAQTPFQPIDPSQSGQEDISMLMLPDNHSIINKDNLVAEAQGLLDRLLDVFTDDSRDAILISATVNCLGNLIRTRVSTADRIFNAALRFDPLKRPDSPLSAKMQIIVRSISRTMRAFFVSLGKKNAVGPYAPRIHEYLSRIDAARAELATSRDLPKKRPAPDELVNGTDDAKRQKLEVTGSTPSGIDQLPMAQLQEPASTMLAEQEKTIASLFKIGTGPTVDITMIGEDQLFAILVPLIQLANKERLSEAIQVVQNRLATARADQEALAEQVRDVDDTEADLPDFDDSTSQAPPSPLLLRPFKLPTPPPFTPEQVDLVTSSALARIFGLAMQPQHKKPTVPTSSRNSGLNRLAASTLTEETFFIMTIRLCTRSSISTMPMIIAEQYDPRGGSLIRRPTQYNMQESIRDALFAYILQDFRTRIPLAISWLTEEWYADRLLLQNVPDASPTLLNYNRLTLRLTDGILPFLDARDKIFIRYLSELPWLTLEILGRVKLVAEDPERVPLAMASLRYLLMFRPPSRSWVCDVLEEVYKSNEAAKVAAGKLLKTWRPQGIVSRE